MVAVTFFLTFFLLALALAPLHAAESTAPSVGRTHEAFFKANCLKCHSKDVADAQGGSVRLDDLPFELATIATAERWQKVLNVLNSGEMPPPEEPRPDEQAKTNLLAELSDAVVKARKSIGDEGRVGVLRRLNRREYVNTIRDLLGVETDAKGLPEDRGGGTYDTFGGALFMSSDQIDRYLKLARGVLTEAFAQLAFAEHPPERRSFRAEPEKHRPYVDNLADQAKIIELHQRKMLEVERWRRAGEPADRLPLGRTSLEAVREAIEALKKPAKGYGVSHGFHGDKYFLAARSISRPRAFEGWYLDPYPLADGDSGVSWWTQYPCLILHGDLPTGSYVIRTRAGIRADMPRQRRFIELCSIRPLEEESFLKGSKLNGAFFQFDPGNVGGTSESTPVAEHDVTATTDDPQVIEFPITVRPGSPRVYSIREKAHEKWQFHHLIMQPEHERYGIDPTATWIDWIEWEGPLPNREVADRVRRLIGPVEPSQEDDPAAVRAILERFATRAFRGTPPERDFLDGLVALQQRRRKAGDAFLASLVEPMAVVLASPGFVYLHDPFAPAPQAPGAAAGTVTAQASAGRTLTDLELASRLSYFLWSAPPDEQLLAAAKKGGLRTPQGLAAETQRLIADPRSKAFAEGFVSQWLLLDRLDFFQFDYNQFRKFDEYTRRSARAEVWQTFHTLLNENLDARKLLKSDFVVINSVLADYYDIPADVEGRPVEGMEFRKVSLPDDSIRGGLLGMACILAMGSNGVSSSPVERGAWILRKLLNDPPPPAPANVPQLSRLEGKPLTPRERLAAHQEQSQCNQCHRRIDPVGFGLENFDASGQWREFDALDLKRAAGVSRNTVTGRLAIDPHDPKNGVFCPVDASGAFFNGPSFKNFFQFRDLVAAHGDNFLRGMVENLYGYALGRPVSFADTDAIDAIVAAAKADGGGLTDIVKHLVATPEFRNR